MHLYIVFSLAKTGSTSFFELLHTQGHVVCHTHSLNSFRVHASLDARGLLNPAFHSHRHPWKQYLDYRNVSLEQLFDLSKFDGLYFVGMFRHPIKRRISQFLHACMLDNILEAVDFHQPCPIMKHNIIASLPQVSEEHKVPYANLLELFLSNFINPDPSEYTEYITCIQHLIQSNSDAPPDLLLTFRQTLLQEGVLTLPFHYAPNIPATFTLGLLERLKDATPTILTALDLPPDTILPRERDSTKQTHVFQGTVQEVQERLFQDVCATDNARVLMQHALVSSLGYTIPEFTHSTHTTSATPTTHTPTPITSATPSATPSAPQWFDGILQYAKQELRLSQLDQHPISDTILTFLKQVHDISGNHPQLMKTVIHSVADLIDAKPISPITEADFESHTDSTAQPTASVWRCTRYPYIYKIKEGNAYTYYNDRAIVYKTSYESPDTQYIYQGGLSSRREITLPYIVREKVVIL